MANSTFIIKIGAKGSSNARVYNALRSGRIAYTLGHRYWWTCRIRAGFTGEADGDQTLDLNAIQNAAPSTWRAWAEFPGGAFPAPVLRLAGSYLRIDTGFSGGAISDVDLELGDAGDPNGLVTITSAFTGDEGTFSTPAAAEFGPRIETAFAPTLRILSTGGNTNAITAGDVRVFIPFMPLPA